MYYHDNSSAIRSCLVETVQNRVRKNPFITRSVQGFVENPILKFYDCKFVEMIWLLMSITAFPVRIYAYVPLLKIEHTENLLMKKY